MKRGWRENLFLESKDWVGKPKEVEGHLTVYIGQSEFWKVNRCEGNREFETDC